MTVLHEAVSEGELNDMKAQLPRAFDQLFLELSGTQVPQYQGQHAYSELF
jgi:hypothetical protein